MTDTENEPNYCPAQTYAQTLETPAEYCENEVENEGDYCGEHGGGDYDGPDYEEPADFDEWRHGQDRYEADYWND